MSCSICGCGTPPGCSCSNPNTVNSNCNPCCAEECNTVACESMASQIANFTKQFFGEVVKTEVDGQIVWTLPCDLETGLPNNPRAADEGIGCYFKRLFEEGIIGLTGPVGPAGAAGTNGFNAYTVTLASFLQPSEAAPTVAVTVLANPAILEGLYVFIGSSGWYVVDFVDPNGVLHLSLAQAVSGAVAGSTITAGKLVVPAGFPGISVTGPAGPQGPTGPQGTAGTAHTTTNGSFFDNTGTNYTLTNTSVVVDFTTQFAQVLLPTAGTYLMSFTADLLGLAGAVAGDFIELKLRNVTDSDDLDGSTKQTTNLAPNRKLSIAATCLYTTTGANRTVRLFGRANTGGNYQVVAARTCLSFVKIA